jgi:hypothetical protein
MTADVKLTDAQVKNWCKHGCSVECKKLFEEKYGKKTEKVEK